MPVQYEGIIAEHRWTRESAGLFDVSHMGQITLTGSDLDAALETLLPADLSLLDEDELTLVKLAAQFPRAVEAAAVLRRVVVAVLVLEDVVAIVREAGVAGIDVFSEWKSIYVDYSGALQRAQIDTEEI